MPVEIRELIVRTKVISAGEGGESKNTTLSDQERNDIIAACTAQVLRILKREQER